MFERILIPLDGSQEAEAIFKSLEDLFRRKDSEIILFQAVHIPWVPGPEHAPPIIRDMETQALSYLAHVQERLEAQGLHVRTVTDIGRPADVILNAAQATRATLIALSTHGRAGWTRLMLGSVTEEVLRKSPVPVLVWRFGKAWAKTGGRRCILVPFDGSPESLAVTPWVIETARLFNAGIALVKVEAGPGAVDVGFVGHLMDGPVDLNQVPEALDRDLLEAGNPFTEAGLPTTVFRVRGEVADQIRKLAGILPAELIAMSTHGRSGLSRLITGSVTEEVVRAADCPVLVMRNAAAPQPVLAEEGRKT